MKTRMIIFLCMIASVTTFGQEQKAITGSLKEVAISPARFSGSKKANPLLPEGKTESIDNYLSRNVQYPKTDAANFTQGTSIVKFVVSPKGEIHDFTVINSVSTDIDEEVIRVLKTTEGMWMPGSLNGKPVAEEREVSVTFKLTDSPKNQGYDYLIRIYFAKGGEMLFKKKDPKKALKYYDKGIVLLPKDINMLMARGMARYELGDKQGAYQDWNRIRALGGLQSEDYLNIYSDFKGIAELIQILKK
ncbi:MAG: energy transducer TonB [Prolixibacteraceae bacterium]